MSIKRLSPILLIIFLVLPLFFNLIPVKATGENWLTGYTYRKSIVVNSASGAGANYQVYQTVYYTTASDTAYNTYTNGKCLMNFGDIRFTASNGNTLLNYGVETNVTSTSAKFWIKITDDISSSGTTYYLYYGNTTVNAGLTTTDLNNVMDFYDDFLGSSIDLTKWEHDTSYATVSSSIMTYYWNSDASWKSMTSLTTFGLGYAIRCNGSLTAGSSTAEDILGWDTYPYVWNQGNYSLMDTAYATNIKPYIYTCKAGSVTASLSNYTEDAYEIFEIQRPSTSKVYFTQNDIQDSNSPITTNIPTISIPIAFGSCNSQVYANWIEVRKCVDPEPTQNPAGAENQNFSIPITQSITTASTINEAWNTSLNLTQSITTDSSVIAQWNTIIQLSQNLGFYVTFSSGKINGTSHLIVTFTANSTSPYTDEKILVLINALRTNDNLVLTDFSTNVTKNSVSFLVNYPYNSFTDAELDETIDLYNCSGIDDPDYTLTGYIVAPLTVYWFPSASVTLDTVTILIICICSIAFGLLSLKVPFIGFISIIFSAITIVMNIPTVTDMILLSFCVASAIIGIIIPVLVFFDILTGRT